MVSMVDGGLRALGGVHCGPAVNLSFSFRTPSTGRVESGTTINHGDKDSPRPVAKGKPEPSNVEPGKPRPA